MPLGCSDNIFSRQKSTCQIYPWRPESQKEPAAALVLHKETDDGVALDLLVHHKAKDTHHGGTAVVELNGTLAELGLLREGVPAEVESAVAEISGELSLASDCRSDS